MTAQIPERLLHNGQCLNLCHAPLYDYLRRLNRRVRPSFIRTTSACHRGYIGTWEFRDGWLCLTGLEGAMRKGPHEVEATLATALPWVKGRLRARWITDWLRCPEGRVLAYAHHAFNSTYERDRLFGVRAGRLEEEYVVLNPPSPIYYRIGPDGQRTCMTEAHPQAEPLPDPLDGRPLTDAHLAWGRPPDPEEDEGYVIAAAYIRSPPHEGGGPPQP